MDSAYLTIGVIATVVTVVMLVLREVTLWYFRINQRFDKLEQIAKNQTETNRILAQIAAQTQAAIEPDDLQ